MKQINATKCDWDKKIQIEMSLRELQEITDRVGVTSFAQIRDMYEKYSDKEKIPYDYNSKVFENLNKILKVNGSIVYLSKGYFWD